MDNKKNSRGLALAALLASVALFQGNGARAENRLVPDAPAASSSSAIPTSALPATQEAAVSPAATAAGASSLVPFEQPASGLTLTGEADRVSLTFSLSEAMRLAGGALQLAYTNAVSVLPDTASVSVTINGKPAGSFPVRSPNGVKLESLPLSAALLKTGRNTVELAVSQHHRVDCSLDATYELWTRFSPEKSGFLAKVPVQFTQPMDLLAVARTPAGFTDLRLVLPPSGDPALVNQALSALQSLALALNRRDLMVTVAGEPGTGPGIDLYVGRGTQTGQSEAARTVFAEAGSGLSVTDAGVAGRARVVLEGGSRKEIDNVLLTALRGPLKDALATGILAGQPGVLHAAPSTAYTLAEAGYHSTPFAGRLARTRFDLDMPADFYPAEYDTMKLYLSGATAPGLMPNAQFLVRVNDRVVTSLPLRKTDGETLRRKRIELPLRAFRPGVNRVELLAELPDPTDAACAPGAREDGKPRFVMLDESTLEIPALARIGRLPDLGAFSGNAYPYNRGKDFTLLVDQPGTPGLSTALTTLSRLALAAGKPLQATLAYGRPAAGMKGDILAISTGASARPVEAAATTQPAGTAHPAVTDAANPGVDAFTTSATGHADAFVSAGSEELLDAFKQSTDDGTNRSVNTRLQDWFGRATERFNSWLRYQDAADGVLPHQDNMLVTVSQRAAPSGDGVWTELGATSEANLQRGFAAMAVPQTWNRLEGGTAAVRADTLELVTHQAEHRFVNEVTDRSFGNIRRLAASWFSDNFQIYVGTIVALMAIFGLWLGITVPKKGVRSEQ